MFHKKKKNTSKWVLGKGNIDLEAYTYFKAFFRCSLQLFQDARIKEASTQGNHDLNKGDAQRLLSHEWQCRNPIQHLLWVGHPFKRQLPRKCMIHSHDLVWDALHKSGHAIALHAPGTLPPPLHLQGIRDKCERLQRVLGLWAEPCMNTRMAGLKLSHPQSSVYRARFARTWEAHPLLPTLLALLSEPRTHCVRNQAASPITPSGNALLCQHGCAKPHNSSLYRFY